MQLFLSQFVQPLKDIFDVCDPYQLLEIGFCIYVRGERELYTGPPTCSSLFEFLCHDGKERNDFNHDVRYYAPHSHSHRDSCINFQSPKIVFDLVEDTDQRILASADVFRHLDYLGVTRWPSHEIQGHIPRGEPRRLQRWLSLVGIPVKQVLE